MAESNINKIAWWLGWNPKTAILAPLGGGVLLGLLTGSAGGIITVSIIGMVVGIGLWSWGVMEVNNKYANLRNDFYETSSENAKRKLGHDPHDEDMKNYDMRTREGGSPPFVEPSRLFWSDHISISDVSVGIFQGALFDMEERAMSKSGNAIEIYYDDIKSIETNNVGGRFDLDIKTSDGRNITMSSIDKETVQAAETELRKKMREVKREKRS